MVNPVLLIDGDPIVYRAAFSAQSTVYEYVYQTSAGEVKQRFFSDGNKALRFFRRYPKIEVLEKIPHVQVREASFARQAAKTVIEHTLRFAEKQWDTTRDNLNVEVYLSGPNNFRNAIATIAEYKGGRKQELPVHYQVVRNYLQGVWNASVVHDWEADDQVAIRCRQLDSDGVPRILATIDKDLDQIPGLHYDYRQHVSYYVSEEDAERWFWVQTLAGDSTDNIPGVSRLGVVGAASMYDEWVASWYEKSAERVPEEWLWEKVVGVYDRAVEMYPDKYPEGITGEQAALETARLVKMMEYEGQLWMPPGEDDLDVRSIFREPS